MARFNDILKLEFDSINKLGDQMITLLVKYIDANQGALYWVEEIDQKVMAKRISTYAYHKKKYVDEVIEAGQGLVGQCLLEKNTIILKDVPRNYITITSGLGEATPSFVILLPLRIREQILGVVEIASFQTLKEYEIEFLEKIAESISSMLASRKSADHTQKLLQESMEQAARLVAQEEEIRQNAEEMQAITEQLERERMELQKEIVRLKTEHLVGSVN